MDKTELVAQAVVARGGSMSERIRIALCTDPKHNWRHFAGTQGDRLLAVGYTVAETYDYMKKQGHLGDVPKEREDMTQHDTMEDFLDAEYAGVLMILAENAYWLAWEAEDGEWYAIRPLGEDDSVMRPSDPNRPVGPRYLDAITFPLTVVFDAGRHEPEER